MSDYEEDFDSPTASPTKSEKASPTNNDADDVKGEKALHVEVLRARNIPTSSDNGSLPDPYCAVLLGDQRHQTPAVDNTTEPSWSADNAFEFKVDDDHSAQTLIIRLWEDDTFSDDKLGGAKLPLKDADAAPFVDGEWCEKTVTIGSASPPCEVDVRIKAVGFGGKKPAEAEQQEDNKEDASPAASPTKTENDDAASPAKSSPPRSPTPSLSPTPRSSANSSPAASPTKSEAKDDTDNNADAAAAADDPAPEEDEKKERADQQQNDDADDHAEEDKPAEENADASAADDHEEDEEGAAAADDKTADENADAGDTKANEQSQSQSKIAQRKRLPPRSGAVATVSYPGERQVAVADILDPTKPLVKSNKPLTRPLGPSFVEDSTAEERRQRRLRQKASSTERTASISEQRDNERRYLKAQQEFEREKRLAERAIYHRERVSQWSTRLGASPLGVDLVADHERIDEEAFVRQREEKRRQALAEKRKRRIKNEIIVKALAEVPLLEEARRQKREMLEEERREKAQRDVQRVEAIQARKLRDMALMKEERQAKLDQRLMNA